METNAQITGEELERRQATIKDLHVFVSDYKNWLDKSMTDLGFTKQHLLQKDEDLVECPMDSNHMIPKRALEKHIKYCERQKKGYIKEEVDMIECETSFWYEKHPTVVSVKLDDDSFQEIMKGIQRPHSFRDIAKEIKKDMPLTGERAQYELRREEKLAVYEHVRRIARQVNPSNIVSEQELLLLQDTKEQKNPAKGKTYLERLAEERDFKRRRQSYRAKNVHVTKKSHTEIIREVISNQMEILGQMWEDDDDSKKRTKSEQDSKTEQSTDPANGDDQMKSRKYRDRSPWYERGSGHRSRSPSDRRYRNDSPDRGHGSRYRSRSPSRKDSSRCDRRRSSSRDRKSDHNKKSKHSKKRSRSKSYDSKDSRNGKSKHKHKKHKHKKDKSKKQESHSEIKPN